jgi:hypothetical protein
MANNFALTVPIKFFRKISVDFFSSVGNHQAVGRDRVGSRPKNLKTVRDPQKNPGRDPEKYSGRDPENFSDRDLEIFQKIYQDIQLDKSNLKFSIGSRP